MTSVQNLSVKPPAEAVKVIHEAVDERQYVRAKLPAKVVLKVGDKATVCELHDISLGGIGLICGEALNVGSLLPASVRLQLNKIQLSIDAKIKVVSQHGKVTGAEFIELDAQKRDILRYLISAYMAGEIADVNGLFNVMQRENYIKARKQKVATARTFSDRVKAMLGTLIYLLVGLTIFGLLAYKIYLYFFRITATQAEVGADSYVVSMPDNGYIKFMIDRDLPRVSAGQPIATVSTQLLTSFNTPSDLQALASMSQSDLQTLLGRSLIETVIASPCDCYAYFPGKKLDSYAYKYEEMVHLIPANQDIFVKASFPFDKLKSINNIASVKLNVFGMTESISGKVVGSAVDKENQALVLTIQPDQKLPLDSYKKPVSVDIFLGLPFAQSVSLATQNL